MTWTVVESVRPERKTASGVERVYEVSATGESVRNAKLAEDQVASYLSGFAWHTGTDDIRELSGGPSFDPANERLLNQYLYGFPAQELQSEEIEGTDREFYRVVARWGVTQTAATSLTASATATLLATSGAQMLTTHSLAAGIQSRSIEVAPVVALLQKDPSTAHFEPYDIGAVNATRVDVDGPVRVRGIDLSSPPVDRRVTMELTGYQADAAQAKIIEDYVKVGAINSDPFTLQGTLYNPGELLLAEFTLERDVSGKTQLSFGFATGPRLGFVVETHPAGGELSHKTDLAGTLQPPAAFGGSSYFYWSYPSTPATVTVGSDELYYASRWDYAWPFIEQSRDGLLVTNEVTSWCVNRLFAVANFETELFGADEL
jgi:hypothetical protein